MTVRRRYVAVSILFVAALVGIGLFLGLRGSAGGVAAKDPTINQYTAKFLCGTIASPADVTFKPLAPGIYNTEINVHNPNNFPVFIQKKAVAAPPTFQDGVFAFEHAGQPHQRQRLTLDPDNSFQIDCADIIGSLGIVASAPSPDCSVDTTTLPIKFFCKGDVVVEAAYQPVGSNTVVAAQLDVTNILTVKEEHLLWKDYTFQLNCLQPNPPNAACPPVAGIANGGYFTDIDWPLALPDPCYHNVALSCAVNDVDTQIRQKLGFVGNVNVQVLTRFVAFATDASDVSLDFEFVTPKRVSYLCWSNVAPTCP